MEKLPRPLRDLIEVFEKLPGIGPKTAARLSFYLFQTPKSFVDQFVQGLLGIKEKLSLCSVCYNIDESNPCRFCQDSSRQKDVICVVERPLDVLAIEQIGSYKGQYHVLGGVINPLLHIGPEDLYIKPLLERVSGGKKIEEIIVATNPTIEGEATSLYLKRILFKENPGLKITRIGHGLPMGADLDYADPGTLSEALKGRQAF